MSMVSRDSFVGPARKSALSLLVSALFLAFGALLLPGARPASTAAMARAQPVLLRMAREQPDKWVRVIIQEQRPDSGVAEAVMAMGGEIVARLDFFRAWSARVPARLIPALSSRAAVEWISLDAPVESTGCRQCIDTSSLLSAYVQTIGASRLWNEAPYLQGQGIGVAIVDSGIAPHPDINSRIIADVNVSDGRNHKDNFGHGTHVAGIVGGDGKRSRGEWIGVAPAVNLINVKVGEGPEGTYVSDVLQGLYWVYLHRDRYNIRVVNLSLNSTVPDSYLTNPLNAALELLWFNGVVVTVSAGNVPRGQAPGAIYPPANDPFLITVGATDDRGTPDPGDDALAAYSEYGMTESGTWKPDIVAPGSNIVSLLSARTSRLSEQHRSNNGDNQGRRPKDYFRMSGTSMASAVTAGAAALLLQAEPYLTPDEVKYRLMGAARPLNGVVPGAAGAGVLDVYAAVHADLEGRANQGLYTTRLLWAQDRPLVWDSLNWGSLNWGSLNWGSLNWGSISWDD